jgi:tetratricopeptide (TPR) repeat protein
VSCSSPADWTLLEFEEALALDPNFSLAQALVGLVYLQKAMPDRAIAAAQKARDLSGPRPDIVAFHGYILARAGRRDDALKALVDLRRLSQPREPSPFQVALGLRRPGRHRSRVRMARQGDRGASLGDADDQGQPDFRTGPIGPPLPRVAPPDRVARLTRLPRSPAVNR